MGEYFSGRVHTILFHNDGFYVMKVVLDPKDDDAVDMFGNAPGGPIGVKGLVPGMNLDYGSWFGFEAKWETHPKFGKQLSITKAPVIRGGWTPETATAMLQSHGVGERILERLNKQFGDDLVDVLNRADESELTKVSAITPFTAALIVQKWTGLRALFQTLEFLADAQVPKHKISEVWQTFGDKAKEILTTNPWALVRIEGIRFEQADEVALRLGLDFKSPFRVQGAALYAAKNRRGMGHLFLSSGDMLSEVQSIASGVKDVDVAKALADLHKEGSLAIDRKTRPGTTAIYEPWLLHLEQQCADKLFDRVSTAVPTTEADPTPVKGEDKLEAALDAAAFKPYAESLSAIGVRAAAAWQADPDDYTAVADAALDDVAEGNHINLSADQRRGALNALTASVSVLAGLPGTGKTTTLQTVVACLKDANIPFLLCAPTGIAAKRMSSLTRAPASTIHRAFHAKGWNTGSEREANYTGVVGDSQAADGSDGSGEAWGFGPDNPHPARVVICDEASMLDQHLLFRILTSTHPKARIVLVGDPAQLPSVGPGNVLRDIINTGLFPTITLTEIYRQEETSDIVLAAHATFRGEIPVTGSTKGSDFVLIEENDEEKVQAIVRKLVGRLYEKRENFQVLSPRHAGTLGVTTLNQRLRTILNPQSPGLQEHRIGNETIREDDRVMVVKNNYKLNIFNGDVGKVSRIDRKARVIEIKLHGPPVVYVPIPFKDASKYLRLAYTVTVHKSQGQEYDIIVMPLVRGFGHQLQRNLFYTAITRAKKKVYLVGHKEALIRAVNNNREDVRNTLFPDRLALAFQGGPTTP